MDGFLECEHGEEMTAYMSLALDGLLDTGDHQRLEQHVATCVACRQEWEAMQQISALFEASALVGPPLGFAIRVERRLAAKKKQQREFFGGLAVLTGSLSLVGVTVAAVLMLVLGIVAWRWFDASPTVQQGTQTVSHVASGMGLLGKGASLFLGDLLLHYGLPFVLLLALGLLILVVVWVWLFVKRPGGTRHNGYA